MRFSRAELALFMSKTEFRRNFVTLKTIYPVKKRRKKCSDTECVRLGQINNPNNAISCLSNTFPARTRSTKINKCIHYK